MHRYHVYLPCGTVEIMADEKRLSYDGKELIFIRHDKDKNTVVAEFYTGTVYGWGLME